MEESSLQIKNLSESEFYEKIFSYRDDLLAIAQMFLRDSHASEDALSDALLKAYGKKDQLRDDDKFLPWLRRIISNHCIDILRKEKRQKHLQSASIEDLPLADANRSIQEKIALAEKIEQVLDIMLSVEPYAYREVLILYYYRQMSLLEIAKITSSSEGTIKSRLSRAREKLKDAFLKQGISQSDLVMIHDMKEWPLILD